jgi:hypothetical protein
VQLNVVQMTAADVCSVCRESLGGPTEHGGPSTIWMLPCGHHFHVECVQPWFLRHQTCPNCRTEVTVEGLEAAHQTLAKARKAVRRHACRIVFPF